MKNKGIYFEKWLYKIGEKFQKILLYRQIYTDFSTIVKSNNNLTQNSMFFHFIYDNYVNGIILNVSGILENGNDSDDLNFRRFLEKLKPNLELIKNHHLNQKEPVGSFEDNTQGYLQEDDILIQFRNAEINRRFEECKICKIDEDIEILEKEFEKYKKIRNKLIAHFTKKTRNDLELPSFKDLDKTIDEIHKIYKKYSLIMNTNTIFDTQSPFYGNVFDINWKIKTT